MKLSARFYLLMTVIFLSFSLVSWLAFSDMVNEINVLWGKRFAERQVLFDKHRTLSPLIREIRLARQMAAEPALIEMALHEEDAAVRRRATKVMERYRFDFRDHSYFAAFARSGNYYFNDSAGQYSDKQYRYTLSPREKRDYWFYATLKSGVDYQVNLDPDVHLGVVKVWINVLLKNGSEVLGVIGTGIDLTEFLKESVDINQPGVDTFFVDKSLAIQLSADPRLIDYASIAKTVGERIKIDALFKNPADIERLRQAAIDLEKHQGGEVSTLWVDYRGEKRLLGMAYLPEVGWYDLTLMDERSLQVLRGFTWLPLLLGTIFLMAMLILGFLLHRWVLDPIARLTEATEHIQRGNYDVEPPIVGRGEISALSRSFWQMVEFVRNTNVELERKVNERTQDLLRLTESDYLTGLLNRRGMTDKLEKEVARQARQGGAMGLLLLDLDHFKQVNDNYGHAAGDLAICATANVLRSMKRSYDYAGRWGGEEFMLLLPECNEDEMVAIAERIREAIRNLHIEAGTRNFTFTVSIGVHYPSGPQTLDTMLQQADKALYAAKDAGRDCVRTSRQRS
ncbi:putative diguanylate cyclase YdaM [mine drainage metagenome]|uniref:Putative diguanylate cyclase YdaM n=1 Tax=mine drainage metagenome TaxID=410659 RepID=A0A1J5SQM8_9ZZZZ